MSIRNAMLTIAAAMFVFGMAFAQQPAAPASKPAAPESKPAAPDTKPAAAPTSQAAEPKATKKAGRDRVCAADAKKFCDDVRPGGGRMYKCLTSHDAELAPACRERLASAKSRWDEFVKACKSDADKYCKGIPTGGGRVLSCLKGREADLTPDCKTQFNGARNNTTVTQ